MLLRYFALVAAIGAIGLALGGQAFAAGLPKELADINNRNVSPELKRRIAAAMAEHEKTQIAASKADGRAEAGFFNEWRVASYGYAPSYPGGTFKKIVYQDIQGDSYVIVKEILTFTIGIDPMHQGLPGYVYLGAGRHGDPGAMFYTGNYISAQDGIGTSDEDFGIAGNPFFRYLTRQAKPTYTPREGQTLSEHRAGFLHGDILPRHVQVSLEFTPTFCAAVAGPKGGVYDFRAGYGFLTEDDISEVEMRNAMIASGMTRGLSVDASTAKIDPVWSQDNPEAAARIAAQAGKLSTYAPSSDSGRSIRGEGIAGLEKLSKAKKVPGSDNLAESYREANDANEKIDWYEYTAFTNAVREGLGWKMHIENCPEIMTGN